MRAGLRSPPTGDLGADEIGGGRRADRCDVTSLKARDVEEVWRYSHASSHSLQPYTVGRSIKASPYRKPGCKGTYAPLHPQIPAGSEKGNRLNCQADVFIPG